MYLEEVTSLHSSDIIKKKSIAIKLLWPEVIFIIIIVFKFLLLGNGCMFKNSQRN